MKFRGGIVAPVHRAPVPRAQRAAFFLRSASGRDLMATVNRRLPPHEGSMTMKTGLMQPCASAAVWAIAVLAPITAHAQNKKDAGGNDAMRLAGVWTLESREIAGQLAPKEAIQHMKLAIDNKGAWMLSFGPGKPTNTALVFIDPTKNPKVMEVRGPKGKVHWSGLYKLSADTLVICRPVRPGGAPPKELKSSEDHILWVWKRAAK